MGTTKPEATCQHCTAVMPSEADRCAGCGRHVAPAETRPLLFAIALIAIVVVSGIFYLTGARPAAEHEFDGCTLMAENTWRCQPQEGP
ncbi:MAG: hypothetical protein JWM47_1899 [Acidimicrobiales bacterium]|nr:hypothetical protein [Acidimicrobiales bacterium]